MFQFPFYSPGFLVCTSEHARRTNWWLAGYNLGIEDSHWCHNLYFFDWHTVVFYREFLTISSALALEFCESFPWWYNPHLLDYFQERYTAYLLIPRAPVMPSNMPLFFPIPRICRTPFRWINHFHHLLLGFCFKWLKKMHVPGFDKCVDRFVKLLQKGKN